MKGILAFFLSLVLCTVSVAAEQSCNLEFSDTVGGTDIGKINILSIKPSSKKMLFAANLPAKAKTQSINTYLSQELKNHNEEISIYDQGYRLTLNEFSETLNDVCFSDYSVLAYTHTNVSLYEGYVDYFVPDYILSSKQADDAAVAMMDEGIQKYIEAVEDVPDLAGKLLIIYDKFCNEISYAYEGVNEDGIVTANPSTICTAYAVFKNHRAVCQGNAIAFRAILQKLNEHIMQTTGRDAIDCTVCYSSILNHIWNAVRLGNQWYYADVTSDDFEAYFTENENRIKQWYIAQNYRQNNFDIEDLVSFVAHNYFLVPFESMKNREKTEDTGENWRYYPSDKAVSCTDDKFTSSKYIFNNFQYCITRYKDGRYAICNENNTGPIYSTALVFNSLLMTPICITESYMRDGKAAITIYPNGYTGTINRIFYSPEQATKINPLDIGTEPVHMTLPTKPGRMFFWKPATIEPLCCPIEINP